MSSGDTGRHPSSALGPGWPTWKILVLFGRGMRMFDVLPSPVELDVVRVIDTPEATHIRYRVRR